MLSKEKNHLRSLAAQTKFQVWLRRQQHLKQWHQAVAPVASLSFKQPPPFKEPPPVLKKRCHRTESPATQGNANNTQCTSSTNTSTAQGGQCTQCTNSARFQCSTNSTSARASEHLTWPSDVPTSHCIYVLFVMLFWMTGGQQTLLSFFGVNQHCYLSCGYLKLQAVFFWLRQEILQDYEVSAYVTRAFFELGNMEGGRVRQVKILSFSCNCWHKKSIELVHIFTPLFGFHYFTFLIKAFDCLRSRLLFKKDKEITNCLMAAIRPLPA